MFGSFFIYTIHKIWYIIDVKKKGGGVVFLVMKGTSYICEKSGKLKQSGKKHYAYIWKMHKVSAIPKIVAPANSIA